MEGMPDCDHRRTSEFPEAAGYTLEAEFPDAGAQPSAPEKELSEAATSSSEITPCFRLALGRCKPANLEATGGKWPRRERSEGRDSVLSDDDKSRNEGGKPRMHRLGVSLLHFRGQTVLLVLVNFSRQNRAFPPHKYS